jgi:hypothetical protein
MVLSAFAVVLTMIFFDQILKYTPLFDSFNENVLIIIYAIIIGIIVIAGFTFATVINFKDNAEYYSVKGNKRAFIIMSVINATIFVIFFNVIGPIFSRIFDFLNQANYG